MVGSVLRKESAWPCSTRQCFQPAEGQSRACRVLYPVFTVAVSLETGSPWQPLRAGTTACAVGAAPGRARGWLSLTR